MQKLDLQNGGMKSKLILHVEKIVFAVAVLLVVTFIYFGAQREGITVTPDQVKQAADSANANINNSEWTPVEKKRWTDPVYEQRAELAQNPINISNYAAMAEFGPPMYQSIQKRTDPKILTLEKLEAMAGAAPFVYDDKRMNALSGGPGGPAMMESGGYGAPYGGGMMEGGYGPAGYGGPGGPQQKDMPPVMSPEQQKRFGPARATAGTRIEWKNFVVLTALIPLEKQWDEFDAALLDAAGYDPQRDVPKYIGFGVRRREMLPDGTWSQYKDLVPQMAFADAMKWAFRPEEVVPPEYTHPLLTFPIAPMLLVDPADYARHSEVPKWTPAMMQGGMLGEGYPGMGGYPSGMTSPDGAPEQKLPEFNADSNFFPGFGGTQGSGMPGMPGMAGEGGSYPGMMGGYPGMEGYGGPGGSGMMTGGRPGRGGRGAMAGGMPGGGMMYEGGMSSGGGMSGAGYSKEKMFRFYDTTVKPNTQYQYQVNLWLEDPNNPAIPMGAAQGGQPGMSGGPGLAPAAMTLSRETLERVALKKAEAGKDPVKLSKASRLETEYSAPSPVVKTIIDSSVIAGSVAAGRDTRSQSNQLMATRESKATVLGVTWDEAEGTLASKKITLERGDSVNDEDDMWVLNPGTLMFDKKEDYQMNTNAVVLDIRGGDGLPGRYRDPAVNEGLVSPGEILVMDSKGNIKIHKELKDRTDFSLFDFTPPEVKKTSSSGTDDPYGYGAESPEMMEGGPGGGRRRGGRMRE
ncbi:hypothetical protein LOC68_11920 [Blastopirellula sp. JC732]|uniref:Uncharacterized protein n=1 Tax=Blastopirellula sediminis TaxID=2894196 RepID=A0A9X1MLM3_9BACT|nr:hypothetical protein [Blastopirellula sediminis]MCC9607601.1 hypothetical protein [Blastopirellula sediminis]MCC9629106.1 hypothetical protein [Blastopirellula sediminis]